MSSMLGKSLLMAQLAAAMMSTDPMSSTGRPGPTPEEIERDKKQAEEKHRKNLLKKGVQEFYIDGKIVLARNYENALRKAKKVG